MELYETLQRLSECSAPTGHICSVADLAAELLAPLTDEVQRVDRLGNVLALRRCGAENPYTVLLDAHLDEVGFVVCGHEDGYLRFCALGGADPRVLPGRELTLMTEPLGFGVVASKPPHVLAPEEREQAPDIHSLYIDVGMTQEEAVKTYPVGTTAVYREKCIPLQGNRVSGKALDNRVCFLVILRTLELLKDRELGFDLWVLGSNMEEIGGNGAAVGAYRVRPNCAVVLDVTFATQPDVSPRQGFDLGGGPTIGVGPTMAGWITERMKASAKVRDIPVNLEIMAGASGTNGEAIQIAREGIATQVLSVPIRYMHTPVELVDLSDVEQAAELLAGFLMDLGKGAPGCFR